MARMSPKNVSWEKAEVLSDKCKLCSRMVTVSISIINIVIVKSAFIVDVVTNAQANNFNLLMGRGLTSTHLKYQSAQ